jgi:outer membrane cobalamin receptor
MRRILSSLLVFFVCAVAAAQPPLPARADSAARPAVPPDSSKAPADSVEIPDTTRMSTPSLVGTADRNLAPPSLRTRDELHWLDYRSLGGIIRTVGGSYLQEQNAAGGYDQAWFEGADWRNVAVTVNGRPMNDPASGIFNLWHFTTEYTDRVEVISGPRSFLYGFGATGATVNLVTKNYNSNKPFTKLNYSEGGYGYGYVDGTFSQNVTRKVNLTFGFQHQTEDGRYPNSASDAWNSREKIRYNVSPSLNVIVAHSYASTQTRLNGGIDYDKTGPAFAFVTSFATVTNPDAFEKVSRHDVDVSIVGTLLNDTINVSSLTLYYSRILREYRDEEFKATSNGILLAADHVSSWSGILATQNLDGAFQRFQAGVNAEIRQIEGSPNLGRQKHAFGAAWAKEELLLGDALTVAGFGRIERELGRTVTGTGADARLTLGPALELFGGLSSARRVPNLMELSWSDSTVTRSPSILTEHHTLVEAGAGFTAGGSTRLQLKFFRRFIDDPILLSATTSSTSAFPRIGVSNGPRIIADGASIDGRVQIGIILLEGNVIAQKQASNGDDLKVLPAVSGSGGIFFRGKLVRDALDLKAGFTGRFETRHQGSRFNGQVLAYTPNGETGLGMNSSVNFVMVARVGDAYIHLVWENLTDVRYFAAPYYAGGDRALRFGFSWEFLN